MLCCALYLYIWFSIPWYLIDVEREQTKGNHDMMTKTNTSTVRTGSYETDYEAIYEADHAITAAEADNLIATKYHMFPITRASYTIDGDTITVRYTVDSCD